MFPRGHLDIEWSDLLFALRKSMREDVPDNIERRIETFWAPGQAVVVFSVRTGFDALLQALAFPPGSEILVSAITIRDMTNIIESHGLIPVPVDLDMDRLSLDLDALQAAITPKTRAILVAHIFGSRMPLDGVIDIGREHGLLVIEDCAQAYAGYADRGELRADVSMFSFGPIKTNTSLGGGIMAIRDPALRDRTLAVLGSYPRQRSADFHKRVLKYTGIKALSSPRLFGLFATACKVTGRNHDQVISHALRGFPGPDLLAKIRRRPSSPLLALIEHRITTFDDACLVRRASDARTLLGSLQQVPYPGQSASAHTYWVVPICPADPDALMTRLWNAGFDATRGASSLGVVEPPASRPESAPVNASRTMQRLLYLPASQRMRESDRRRMAAIVTHPGCHTATSRPDDHRVSGFPSHPPSDTRQPEH